MQRDLWLWKEVNLDLPASYLLKPHTHRFSFSQNLSRTPFADEQSLDLRRVYYRYIRYSKAQRTGRETDRAGRRILSGIGRVRLAFILPNCCLTLICLDRHLKPFDFNLTPRSSKAIEQLSMLEDGVL